MATSTHRGFEYSLQKENSRVAINDFSKILNSALEQYQKLWHNYLDLIKDYNTLCPDAQEKKERQSHDNKNSHDIHLINEKEVEMNSKSVLQDISDIFLPDTSFLRNSPEKYTFPEDNTDNDLLSPILNSNHRTSKRSTNSSMSDATHNSPKNSSNASICDTSVSIDKQTKKGNTLTISAKCTDTSMDDLNCSEIESSPVINECQRVSVLTRKGKTLSTNYNTKKCDTTCTPKKTGLLGISKLYSVDTKILSSGKKVKQTTLMFHGPKKNTHVNTTKELESSPERLGADEKYGIENESMIPETPQRDRVALNDDTVEDSPCQTSQVLQANKKLKLKRKPRKINNDSRIIKSYAGSHKSDGKRGTKFGMTFSSPLSLSHANVSRRKTSAIDDSLRSTGTKEVMAVMQDEVNSKDEKNISDPGNMSSSFGETFFAAAEDWKENDMNASQHLQAVNKDQGNEAKHLMSPARQPSLNDSDMIPWTTKHIDDKTRKRAERRQMNGWSCWQCKQYYECLGLTEKELQFHKDQCSRHRSKYEQVKCTPASLWDVGFPEEPLSLPHE